MKRPLSRRIAALEGLAPRSPVLSPAAAWAETVRRRAAGQSEEEIIAAVRDGARQGGGGPDDVAAEYDVLDVHGLWLPPRSWLTDHRHPFIRCVARWTCGVVNLVTHPADPPRRIELRAGSDVRTLDPLWLVYFARLIATPQLWRTIWQLPAATRSRLDLPGWYAFAAGMHVRRFESAAASEAAQLRTDFARFRDWIVDRQRVDGAEELLLPAEPVPDADLPWPVVEPTFVPECLDRTGARPSR